MSEFDAEHVKEQVNNRIKIEGDPPWLSNEQLKIALVAASVDGARWQHSQDAAQIEKLEQRVKMLREAMKEALAYLGDDDTDSAVGKEFILNKALKQDDEAGR